MPDTAFARYAPPQQTRIVRMKVERIPPEQWMAIARRNDRKECNYAAGGLLNLLAALVHSGPWKTVFIVV